MAQIFDPLPSHSDRPILCCYVNATSHIQIARITNISNWYFERVVFPGQRLVFEAIPAAHLEIHTGMMASAILSDTIPCDRLCIQEEVSAPDLTEHQLERLNEGDAIEQHSGRLMVGVLLDELAPKDFSENGAIS